MATYFIMIMFIIKSLNVAANHQLSWTLHVVCLYKQSSMYAHIKYEHR